MGFSRNDAFVATVCGSHPREEKKKRKEENAIRAGQYQAGHILKDGGRDSSDSRWFPVFLSFCKAELGKNCRT